MCIIKQLIYYMFIYLPALPKINESKYQLFGKNSRKLKKPSQ